MSKRSISAGNWTRNARRLAVSGSRRLRGRLIMSTEPKLYVCAFESQPADRQSVEFDNVSGYINGPTGTISPSRVDCFIETKPLQVLGPGFDRHTCCQNLLVAEPPQKIVVVRERSLKPLQVSGRVPVIHSVSEEHENLIGRLGNECQRLDLPGHTPQLVHGPVVGARGIPPDGPVARPIFREADVRFGPGLEVVAVKRCCSRSPGGRSSTLR
ncbi:hypothetical protein B0H12DRAFT_1111702 [Mycena haematopus]|nr:hypothetical protein B0H12DRAFT_1111702 [Mycena haematopus]